MSASTLATPIVLLTCLPTAWALMALEELIISSD